MPETDLNVIDNASEEELYQMLEAEQGTQEEHQQAEVEEPSGESEPSEQAEPEENQQEVSIEDRLKALEENNAKLQKRLKDKDSFIERRNAEVGELRKAIRERELAELPDEVDVESEEFFENPKEAVNKILEAKQKKAALLDKIKAEEQAKQVSHVKSLITEIDPDFEDRIPDIVKILKDDGAAENIIEQFENKPFASFNPAVTLQLIKRASLTKRVEELEAKLKEAQGKPSKMLDNLNKYGKAKSKVSSSRPSGKPPKKSLDGLTMEDIDKLSYEELKELEARL